MIAIFDREGVFVLQGNHCISKIDSVLTEIFSRLPWIPLKVHVLSVCTIRAHVNVDKSFYLSEV